MRPGDVIWIPSGEKHWHGASATTPMTHTAVQKRLNSQGPLKSIERVGDAQSRQ